MLSKISDSEFTTTKTVTESFNVDEVKEKISELESEIQRLTGLKLEQEKLLTDASKVGVKIG